MTKNQQNGKINFKMVLILTSILGGFIYYWYETKDSISETYSIKPSSGDFGYKQSYINRTGKEVEDKKIDLSDDYWTKGKFGF